MKLPMSVLASAIGLALGLPLSPTHASMGGGGAWTPALWFLASEQGIWLDPSDFTRYMGELGPELVLDPEFNNAGNWTTTPSWTVSGGVATHNGSAADYIYTATEAPVVGKWYLLTVTATTVIGVISVYCGQTPAALNITTPGTHKIAVQCPGTGLKFSLRCSNASGGNTVVTAFSAKELTAINTATLYQDSVGTTPVTAVEQPVGLAFDKRLGLTPLNGPLTGWSKNGGDGTVTVVGAAITVTGATTATQVRAPATGPYDAGWGPRWYPYHANGGPESDAGFLDVIVNVTSMSGTWLLYVNGSPITLVMGKNRFSLSTNAVGSPGELIQGTGAITVTVEKMSFIRGNHARQPTTAQKPVLSARKNKLDATDTMSSGSWLVSGTATRTTGVADPFGGTTAVRINLPAADGSGFRSTTPSWAANENVVISVWMRSDTVCTGWVQTNSGILIPGMVLNLTPDWQKFEISIAGGSADSQLWFARRGGAYGSATMIEMCQPDAASGPMRPYQRVNTNTDYDTVGFPHYLKFDGVDDNLATGNIDFTATDAVTVMAALQKFGRASVGDIVGLTSDPGVTNGSFLMTAPAFSNSDSVGWGSRGTAFASNNQNSAPYGIGYKGTLTGTADISLDTAALRSNGVQLFNATADQGTGNYANAPLYIGRRGGTSAALNANLYQLTVRGAATADLTPGETLFATKL